MDIKQGFSNLEFQKMKNNQNIPTQVFHKIDLRKILTGIFFSLYFLFTGTILCAQFEVVIVQGDVRYLTNKQPVKLGDKVDRNVELIFKNPNWDYIGIYNVQVGRILLPEKLEENTVYYNIDAVKQPFQREHCVNIVTKHLIHYINRKLILNENSRYLLDFDSLKLFQADKELLKKIKISVRYKYVAVLNGKLDTVTHFMVLADFYNQVKNRTESDWDWSLLIPNKKQLIAKNGQPLNPELIIDPLTLIIKIRDEYEGNNPNSKDKFPRSETPLLLISPDDPIQLKGEVETILKAHFQDNLPLADSYKLIYEMLVKKYGVPPISMDEVALWVKNNFTIEKKN